MESLDKTLESFVIFINNENLLDFERISKNKIVLVSNRRAIPPLWKVLSKEFKNDLAFGYIN